MVIVISNQIAIIDWGNCGSIPRLDQEVLTLSNGNVKYELRNEKTCLRGFRPGSTFQI